MTKTQNENLLLWMEAKNQDCWNCLVDIQSESDGSLSIDQQGSTQQNTDCDITWPAGEAGCDNNNASGIIYKKFKFSTTLN